jgi:integrase/recombinase XerD
VRLSTAVRQFVHWKRAHGARYHSVAILLHCFSRSMRNCLLNELTPARISRFLNRDKARISAHTRIRYYGMIAVFCRFLQQNGNLKRWPMPAPPPQPEKTYVPYIYSRDEIRRLVSDEVLNSFVRRPPTLIDPQTFRTLFLFLYGTGVSISEALTLRRNRLDLTNRTVEVAMREGSKTRVIPIGRDICKLLRDYLRSRDKIKSGSTYVFINRAGEPLKYFSLRHNFRDIRRAADITRSGPGYSQPRMHDFRYTFAVHRIASWYRAGVDMQDVIPALTVYMGRVNLRATERLLLLTPEHFVL